VAHGGQGHSVLKKNRNFFSINSDGDKLYTKVIALDEIYNPTLTFNKSKFTCTTSFPPFISEERIPEQVTFEWF
jgi:hypothetical protein